ncbi:DUF5455 family protein [Beggiatoa leptomitoformis]|uniref:Uncharacterized protein n=1 Tax=Beggiatoa leptomitoformis TaxID=288004 RepID=A0A2N9YCU2_9GAMM|nr:DUF5455 family protein [Beggiatoa leptomitoformis]ALG66449.1 hypothetical protein AL038_00210 [Beggiatoa leptomitoformis]AUI68270.1 hypothetical protein BLE401_05865 [Beggiatoa leptomitoformis]
MGAIFKAIHDAIADFHRNYILALMAGYKRHIAWLIAWVMLTTAIINLVLSVFSLLYVTTPSGVKMAIGLISPPNLIACISAIAAIKLILLIYRYKLAVAARMAARAAASASP